MSNSELRAAEARGFDPIWQQASDEGECENCGHTWGRGETRVTWDEHDFYCCRRCALVAIDRS